MAARWRCHRAVRAAAVSLVQSDGLRASCHANASSAVKDLRTKWPSSGKLSGEADPRLIKAQQPQNYSDRLSCIKRRGISP